MCGEGCPCGGVIVTARLRPSPFTPEEEGPSTVLLGLGDDSFLEYCLLVSGAGP